MQMAYHTWNRVASPDNIYLDTLFAFEILINFIPTLTKFQVCMITYNYSNLFLIKESLKGHVSSFESYVLPHVIPPNIYSLLFPPKNLMHHSTISPKYQHFSFWYDIPITQQIDLNFRARNQGSYSFLNLKSLGRFPVHITLIFGHIYLKLQFWFVAKNSYSQISLCYLPVQFPCSSRF